MFIDTLKRANELKEIIDVTKEELENIKKVKVREEKETRFYDDGLYGLNISEYRDGNGETSANLQRYCGNAELLDVIITTLTRQLEEFEDEFAKL